MILDEVNVKVDGAVEHSHQVRQLGDALDEGGKLYIKLKTNIMAIRKAFNINKHCKVLVSYSGKKLEM